MRKSIVTIFLTFLCVLVSMASLLFAQTPLRDLRVGNKFSYFYFYQLARDSDVAPPTRKYAVEEVVGDTVIQNTRYAKILNSANSSFRYERSNDTAIYVWNGRNEEISYRWTVRRSESFYASTLGYFSSGFRDAVFQIDSNDTYAGGDTTRTLSLLLFPTSVSVGIKMQKGLGVSEISESFGGGTRNAYRRSNSLKGAVIGGKVWGDTAHLRATIRIPALTQSVVGDTVNIPLYFDGYTAAFGKLGATYTDIQFDTTALKLLPSSKIQTTMNGDTVKLFTLPGKPDSTGLLHTLRFVVLRSTFAPTAIKILRFSTLFEWSFYKWTLQSGMFQGREAIRLSPRLQTPSIAASIGERAVVSISLYGIRQFATNGITTASTNLSFNASLLEPLEQTPRGTVQNGRRTIPITFSWGLQSTTSDSITLQLPFRAVLGNAVSTTLSLDSLRITTTNADVRLQQTLSIGTFSLSGINRAGDSPALFFSHPTKMRLVSLAPNPANDIAQIGYSLDIASMVELKVYTINAEAVFSKTLGIDPQGAHTFSLPTHALPTGSYNAVILVNGIIQGQASFLVVH